MSREIPQEFQRYVKARHDPAPDEKSTITCRSLFIGALLALFIGVAAPYSSIMIRGSAMASNFSTPAALFVFFIFVGLINVALGLIRQSFALSRAELAVVYIMAAIATSIPTVGFTQYALPIIAGLYYYTTPENNWAQLIHPHLPEWITPQDTKAIEYFFEGLPPGTALPWEAWIKPLSYWLLFAVALYWVSICTMVILRRQWMEHEKILYPLAQIPLDMIQDDERGSLIKPFFRNPLMWMGFALPFFIGTINALHNYYPGIASINTSSAMTLWGGSLLLRLDINLALIGFAFLLSRDMALSFWLFFLLSNLQRSAFHLLGIQSTEELSRFATLIGPYMAHQAMGAMIALVLTGLWMARGHLKEVLLKAFRDHPTVEDKDEIMSYRAAVWGLLIGLGIMQIWLWQSGLPWWLVPLFLFAAFVIFIALTRAVVEGGISLIRTPITPADFVISGLGTTVLGPSGLKALAFTYIWSANLRIFFMPCFANALKLAEVIRGNKRWLLLGALLAIALSLIASIWTVLSLAYQHGGINLYGFYFSSLPRYAFEYITPKLESPVPVSLSGWGFTMLGATLMSLLSYLRYRFVWWPIHPLGFATGTFYIMNWVWFSMFLAWACKTALLRLGGSVAYTKMKPFFLGLILGQVAVSGLWLSIDFFTGRTGNSLGYF